MTKKDFEQWLDEKCVVKRKGIERLYSEADIRELMNTFVKTFSRFDDSSSPGGLCWDYLKEGGWIE